MAVGDIQKYFEENKDKVSRDVIVEQLRKNGYPESEIQQALTLLGQLDVKGLVSVVDQSAAGKIGRFIGGFLTSVFSIFIGNLIGGLFSYFIYSLGRRSSPYLLSGSLFGPLIGIAGSLFVYFRFRYRSPYFARGALVGLILLVVVAISFIIFIFYAFRGLRFF